MNLIKNIFRIVWRLWFYGLIFFTVLFALPILLITTAHDKFYKTFYKIARAWGKTIMFGMGFWSKVKELQKVDLSKSYMFIANHTSMIDIMLMLSVVKSPCVFVGKEELTKIPLFGYIFKRSSITVNRSNASSRKDVYFEAQKRLNNGMSICIFPEGLVPDDESVVLSEFKNGAFRLAIEHQIPIVPISFYDCKKRLSYTFFSGGPGKLRATIHHFIQTEGKELKDREAVKNEAFDLIYNDLISDLENT